MDERAAERKVGKELFGRWARLAVARWALKHGTFFQGEAAEGVRYSASAVRDELDRLTGLGMLQRVASQADRRVYYTRIDHDLWDVIRAADRVVRQMADPTLFEGAREAEA